VRRGRRIFGLIAVAVVALPLLMYLVAGSAAFLQKTNEVAVRGPGERRLRPPVPARPSALEHVDFAYLSEAAYDELAGREPPQAAVVGSGPCPTPDSFLASRGWKRWATFPSAGLARRAEALHLRVQVWENASRSPAAVAVAFGGTVFYKWEDWLANLRWFLPTHEDQYTEIVERVGPAFVSALDARSKEPGMAILGTATIYTTGHSLGGGLAQQFAYALPFGAGRTVATSYVFDPSPVTGFYSVAEEDRDRNRETLAIDRVYERGEILAALRLGLGLFYKPSAARPAISNTRYDLVDRNNPLAGHSMADLACGLYRVAGLPSAAPGPASE
jgi:hypothetical protein